MRKQSGYWLLLVLCFIVATQSAFTTPTKRSRQEYEQQGSIIWEAQTEHKMMALTFDDGPDPRQTVAILDILKRYDVKSTFFVIGKRVTKYPQLAKRIVEDGHELANHTYNHVYFNRKSSHNLINKEIQMTQQAIQTATGQIPTLFRPPGGNYNDLIVDTSRQKGLKCIMWSWHQDTRDWDLPGVNKIKNKVLNNARNGDIVLFHDYVHGRTQTPQALEMILPELKRRGYQFVTVSELIKHSDSQRKVHQKRQEGRKQPRL
ncbi:polysaccharide deacetylase family protein [Paenibacillus agilis]|uniref:Polysaccharide deacetylase family protein n=1 Tax=Paenibacillus agilis TaxID=3020863 RepID=A0A559J1S3_9BACL|nr:polysaccharide deacetylase family protein [Paenibacillus agilis]TVX93834.1 polysaccharide deacetylase family protein [Paenibacillus agilis]